MGAVRVKIATWNLLHEVRIGHLVSAACHIDHGLARFLLRGIPHRISKSVLEVRASHTVLAFSAWLDCVALIGHLAIIWVAP